MMSNEEMVNVLLHELFAKNLITEILLYFYFCINKGYDSEKKSHSLKRIATRLINAYWAEGRCFQRDSVLEVFVGNHTNCEYHLGIR